MPRKLCGRFYAQVTAQALGKSAVLRFASPQDLFVIVDAAGSGGESGDSFLQQALSESLADGEISGALIAKNERESRDIWSIREDSFVADGVYPHGFWYDVSVPQNRLDSYAEGLFRTVREIDPGLKVFLFGHLGDGNLHLTITSGQQIPTLEGALSDAVFAGLAQMGGSFSAEHGIGIEKMQFLLSYGDPTKVDLMRHIKQVLDPKGIMNPGKVI